MPLPLSIARRYLFSKKSHSAINIVSLISVCGVAVGTMALVVVLSVYNGFRGVIEGLFSNFDPQIRIESAEGKYFQPDSVQKVLQMAEVDLYSYVIQENALLKFKDKQLPVTVKGVDSNYDTLTHISDIMVRGEFSLHEGNFKKAVTGATLASNIGSGVYILDPIILYAPVREGKISMLRPDKSFHEELVYPAGSFLVRQEKYDNTLIIVPIEVARSLFEYGTEVTSVDIKLKDGVSERRFIKEAQKMLGAGYEVNDRYAQQQDFYRMMEVEKWITYLILMFILMIAIFNIIGSLSMLMIEKQEDVKILSNLGMRRRDIFRIFLGEGALITISGVAVGIILGLLICWLQAEFGIVTMGSAGSFIVNAYPVEVKALDVLVIFVTVSILGFVSSAYPASQVLKNNNNRDL